MNENTKDALLAFIEAVQSLAVGTIHMIGREECEKILDRCENLMRQIRTDETIP